MFGAQFSDDRFKILMASSLAIRCVVNKILRSTKPDLKNNGVQDVRIILASSCGAIGNVIVKLLMTGGGITNDDANCYNGSKLQLAAAVTSETQSHIYNGHRLYHQTSRPPRRARSVRRCDARILHCCTKDEALRMGLVDDRSTTSFLMRANASMRPSSLTCASMNRAIRA